MKIFLVARGEYSFTPTDGKNAGVAQSGFSYIGYMPNGQALKFTSQNSEHQVHMGEVGYDADRAVDLRILTKLFGGKVKYQEDNTFEE